MNPRYAIVLLYTLYITYTTHCTYIHSDTFCYDKNNNNKPLELLNEDAKNTTRTYIH